jgi:FKBP-type peptidyl-prolyl cis-trans isomerase SlyD
MLIAKNSVVSFHYKVATADGEQVDRSEEGKPMSYLHGSGQLIAGVEEAMIGKQKGDHVETTIPPEKGYGVYDANLDREVPLDAFPKDARKELKPGFNFVAEHPEKDGERVMFTVMEIEGESVRITANHPLAGQTLLFTIDVVDVRPATAEELSHGHAHGPGGHHHH